MICSYCDSKKHNILSCPEDNELDKILTSDTEPNFSNFSLKTLKKLMVILDVKPSYPPIRMRLILKRRWMYEKKKREETKRKETKRKEIKTDSSSALIRSEQIHECPICMDDTIECVTATCTTPCSHTFCTTCFVMSVMRKNTCPMCRTHIIDNNDYVDIRNRDIIHREREHNPHPPPEEPVNVIYPMNPTPPFGIGSRVEFTTTNDAYSFSFTYSLPETQRETDVYISDMTVGPISSDMGGEYVSFGNLHP